MNIVLGRIEARILGVLIEKQMATPDYYPMTLNALINACNQKTNRDPVMDLDEPSVVSASDALREKRLAYQVKTHGSRALKYEHNVQKIADFSERELAVLCELLLRGPQTAGELNSRTNRLTDFPGLSAVERALQQLENREDGPFVVKLPRRPGQKENRYANLFSETPIDGEADVESETGAARTVVSVKDDRLDLLEMQVADLKAELDVLKNQFLNFKKQFE